MSESTEPHAKIVIRTTYDDGSADVETPWAHDLGNDRYKLDNLLWFAYGISWHDVVLAPFDPDEGRPVFERVVEKSGHRTVRIIFPEGLAPGSPAESIKEHLLSLGCSFEGMNHRLFSFNIPPGVLLEDVRAYLIEQDAQWEHADPTYEELFPDAD